MANITITTMETKLETSKLKLSKIPLNPPPPSADWSEVKGMLKNGTVNVRPNWISWEVVPVTPKNRLTWNLKKTFSNFRFLKCLVVIHLLREDWGTFKEHIFNDVIKIFWRALSKLKSKWERIERFLYIVLKV